MAYSTFMNRLKNESWVLICLFHAAKMSIKWNIISYLTDTIYSEPYNSKRHAPTGNEVSSLVKPIVHFEGKICIESDFTIFTCQYTWRSQVFRLTFTFPQNRRSLTFESLMLLNYIAINLFQRNLLLRLFMSHWFLLEMPQPVHLVLRRSSLQSLLVPAHSVSQRVDPNQKSLQEEVLQKTLNP